MSVGIVKSGSASVFYETFGDENNQPLILLHGNGESRQHFKKHIEIFKEKYYVIAVDSRGHGDSGFGFNSLSLSMMVIDLENILKQLNITKANILGFSDGANVAMLFAIKNPQWVKSLVLVSGNLFFKGLDIKTRFWIAFGYYFSKLAGKIDQRNKIYNEFYLIMYKEPDLKAEQLRVINSPTLVIGGTKDMVKTEHTRLIAENIKNSKLKLIDNADHFYIYKNWEDFCKLTNEFLAEIN